jgi:hypothetical protein
MMTINFHNKTGSKDLYLFFDYADALTSGVTGFSNMSYLQPWKDGTLPLDSAYTCSFDWINSGTFWFLMTNETGANTITNHPNTAMGTADPNWVGGFFELTSLESDNMAYFDVTNVDQVGLVCGAKFSDGTHCGYGETANELISGLINGCGLSADTSAKVSIKGTDGTTYKKLWGPTVAQVSSQYSGAYDAYIKAIKDNITKLTFNADSTIGSPHCGTQLGSFKFTGYFGAPKMMPAGSSITDMNDIVASFEAIDCPKKGDITYIYLTKEALNGGTIMSGSSSGGMYVYPAFEYANPTTPSKIEKGGWANDVSLNWTATGVNAVKDTTCFQAMISSVGRDLVTAMNLGYIGVTKKHNDFVYQDATTYASAETQKKYINEWNKYITENSDSYGMAYSDGTHAKVQFHPPVNGTIDCFVLSQDDPSTDTYWSKYVAPKTKPGKGGGN